MAGIQPIGSFLPSNYAAQISATAYPLNIDADLAVGQRITDKFAPRPLPAPAMALFIDPGYVWNGAALLEVGGWTQGTTTAASNAISVTGQTGGLGFASLAAIGYSYVSGAIQYTFATGAAPYGMSVVTGFSGTTATVAQNAANGGSGTTLVFGQPIGNPGGVTGTVTNGSNVISGLQSVAGMFVDMAVSLSVSGLASGTTITSIDSATQIHVSNTFTGTTASGVTVSVTIPAPASNPRIDRVVIAEGTGAALWLMGSEAASPTPPAIPVGYLPGCALSLPLGITALAGTSNIIDERALFHEPPRLVENLLGALARYTYSEADRSTFAIRGYTGTMMDTLPGSAAPLPNGWWCFIANGSAAALTLTVGSGGMLIVGGGDQAGGGAATVSSMTLGVGQFVMVIARGAGTYNCILMAPQPAAIYQYAAPSSGNSITINDGTQMLVLDPAATLATLTVTMPAHPSDGQRVGLSSTQAVTTLTLNANAGQSFAANAGLGTLTAGSAGASWLYRAATATWYRGG